MNLRPLGPERHPPKPPHLSQSAQRGPVDIGMLAPWCVNSAIGLGSFLRVSVGTSGCAGNSPQTALLSAAPAASDSGSLARPRSPNKQRLFVPKPSIHHLRHIAKAVTPRRWGTGSRLAQSLGRLFLLLSPTSRSPAHGTEQSILYAVPDLCPHCRASESAVTLVTSMVRYYRCSACQHRWTVTEPSQTRTGPV